MERIMNTLPDQDLMCAQMAVSFTLSNPPADEVTSYASKNDHYCFLEVFLGEFPMKLFTEKKPLAVLEHFSKEVQQIGNSIRER